MSSRNSDRRSQIHRDQEAGHQLKAAHLQPEVHVTGSRQNRQQRSAHLAALALLASPLQILEHRPVLRHLSALLARHELHRIEHTVQPDDRQGQQEGEEPADMRGKRNESDQSRQAEECHQEGQSPQHEPELQMAEPRHERRENCEKAFILRLLRRNWRIPRSLIRGGKSSRRVTGIRTTAPGDG
jgi:hypothetical protein